ncbi:MAG: hypothetical protein ACRCSP_10280 [Rhodoglobus sp.]
MKKARKQESKKARKQESKKARNILRFTSVITALATIMALSTPSAEVHALSGQSGDYFSTFYTEKEAAVLWGKVQIYIDAHPNDLAGIERLTKKLYKAPDMNVSVDGVAGHMNGEQAQKILDARENSTDSRVEKTTISAQIPIDAFTVSFSWISRPLTGKYFPYAAYGTWNFRDDYVNGSDPDDIASNRLELNGCTKIMGTYGRSYLYDGTKVSGNGYLYDAGLGTNAAVYGFDDAASGFKLTVDHGYVLTDVGQTCGPITNRGMFTYEHNQDGGAVTGVSASFLGFSVSYTGGPVKLQKSSGIASHTT